MTETPPTSATAAVFLSYSRDDLNAVRRIADTLRAAGIEVWFDQNELVGGDAWDQKIRQQVKECTLFVPVISAHTQARREGYFRLEWHLAEDRTRLIAKGTPFLVPVVIDATAERDAIAPEAFLAVQWTRLPGGETTPAFVARVQKLLGGKGAAHLVATPAMETGRPRPVERDEGVASPAKSGLPPWIAVALGAAVLALIAYVVVRPATKEIPVSAPASKPTAETKTISAPSASNLPPPASAVPLAPDKSIAVLPFENMSPDKDNAFFADGVHEDVITSLTKIRDLKVIGRTSVLAYRDPATRNHKKIAADLGVATLLEGSVRRAGTKVRVSAQLIDARTDESLWAATYDLDLTDVFTIQSALAQNITAALKANFTAGERAFVAERPTQNQEAYDLFVRARSTYESGSSKANTELAIALFDQAVAKDPAFVAAYAQLAFLNGRMYWFGTMDPTPARRERAKAALDTAVRLAPDKPATRMAAGIFAYFFDNDWSRALGEFRAASAQLPNDAQLIYFIGLAHRRLGELQDAAVYFARAMELNPLDGNCAWNQLETLNALRRYAEVRDLGARYVSVFPDAWQMFSYLTIARLELGHEVAAYFQNFPQFSTDPDGLIKRYQLSTARGDFAAAESALADSRLAGLPGTNNVANDPVALHRALVAFLRGQREAARTFADEAVAYYRTQPWTPRQTGVVTMGTALAHALAGRDDEALAQLQEGYAWQQKHDRYVALQAQGVAAWLYLVLNRRDDAFAVLREMMTGPFSIGPERIRLDPLWARVKDDPRFEEILKLAKPL